MITGELKNKIDGLWDIFAAGGLVNPLEVIEQITYLMFIHDLDDSDNMRARESAMLGLPFQSIFSGEVKIGERTIDGSQLKWSVFHDFPADRMYMIMQEWVFPFIKNLHNDKNSAYSKYMDDAIFKLPTPLLLSKVVDSLDEIYKLMNEIQTADVRGDVYEYLLSKIAQSGRNGQFRTPRHIIRMMVEMMDPSSDEIICDPACGTSGFLVAAGEYLKEKRKEEIFYDKQKKDHYMNHMFHGYDMDRTMLRIGVMNMMTHGIENPYIEYRDSLSDQNADKDQYSLVLANPPFKGSLDAESVSGDLLKVCKTKKTELLFLEEGGIPYVSIKDCDYKTGKIDFEGARKVSPKVLEEHMNRYTLHDGDFVVGKIGTIGNPVFVPARNDYTLSANVVLVQPNSELVNPYFLKYSFESDFVERQFAEAKNSTSQAAFGIQKVRTVEVMNPDLDVQREFEIFVKQVNKSKVKVQKALDETQKLFDSLMQQYFG